MPKTKISEFSATPANNTDIDSINIAEGCAPSGINDAIRELMAQLKDFQTGAVGDSFNGPIGTSTAAAGAFTTLSASSTLGVTGVSTLTGGAVVQGLTVGRGAGAVSTNTAVGASALAANTSGAFNTAIGNIALTANTSAQQSVAVGHGTLQANTTGDFNNALGSNALRLNTTGANNTALGHNTLYSNTTASQNTAVGYQAGYTTTVGNTTSVGYRAGYSSTTGGSWVAVGNESLYSNTTGSENTSIGSAALFANTTGSSNVALGRTALFSNTTGSQQTAVGYQAGYNTTGAFNTYFGYQAGRDVTTGTVNTFVGNSAGNVITTGSKNTIIGGYSGNGGGLDIRTASNYIVLSDGDGNPRLVADGNSAWRIPSGRITVNAATFSSGAQGYIEVEGDPASVRNLFASNNTAAGTGSVGFFAFKRNGTYTGGISQTDSATSFVTSSDYRLKENVSPMTGALAKVSQLKPCTYTWKASGEASQGFIAHELAEVCPEAVFGEKDAVYEDGSIKSQGIDTSFLVATLTAAIQELKAEFDAYKASHP